MSKVRYVCCICSVDWAVQGVGANRVGQTGWGKGGRHGGGDWEGGGLVGERVSPEEG